MKNKNLDFLFIGGLYPKEKIDSIMENSKRGIQLAANNFQWDLVKGFDKNLQEPIKIMNIMFIGSYPKNYNKLLIKGFEFSHSLYSKDVNLGFLNIPILKHFTRAFKERSTIREWVKSNSSNKKMVFIYSLDPRFVRIVKLIKRYNSKVTICISINDLPENIMLGKNNQSIIIRLWKSYNKIRVRNGLKHVDCFMIVTKQIKEKLKLVNKPCVIIEALKDIETYPPKYRPIKHDNIKRIVYTGSLIKKYGIINLLEAFLKIKELDYQLLISGDGSAKDTVIDYSKKDSRIKYLGVLSPDKTLLLQTRATVLVNPRQNTNDYTKYSFPIKNVEYLLSGNPVICYKLDGIPKEYDQYLLYVNDDSVCSLRDKIVEVCQMSTKKRNSIGDKGRQFVCENKNVEYQTNKILRMMENCNIKEM